MLHVNISLMKGTGNTCTEPIIGGGPACMTHIVYSGNCTGTLLAFHALVGSLGPRVTYGKVYQKQQISQVNFMTATAASCYTIVARHTR